MSLNHSPKILTDGLVACFDAANVKSFRGEPTTNLIPDASNNGRFTTSNSWATYNTNQYCGSNGCGQFWPIPAISSVSNNIVTTVSSHPMRSFDVLRPQTSGGGLTANTDYVVKKISSTQFSLHAYDGSQDGSRGYINPSTGFFKVHDAYATDTRIAVNSTDFPTMWWGAPHLPNSGLIKEIVPNGGYVTGTNCMRLHVYRGDGVVDGMAYGVYPHVTAGDIITVSVYVRTTVNNGVGKGLSFSTYFGPGQPGPGGGINMTTPGVWQRLVTSWTAPVTYDFILYWWPEGSSSVYSIDMADLQVEINKGGRATAFTTGTRGATVATGGGWADLSGNASHGELINNPSYDTTNLGNISFDGSNDRIQTSYSPQFGDFTVCLVFKDTGSGSWGRVVDKSYSAGFFISSYFATYGGGYIGAGIVEPNPPHGIALPYTANEYHFFTVVRNGTTHTIYLDGITQTTSKTGSNALLDTTSIAFGDWSGSNTQPFKGLLPVVMIYNRALSTTEILQNLNAVKSRFGSLGYSPMNPATSASAILIANPSATNGLYWIYNSSGVPVQCYCDMTTADEFGNKGWMLVASWNTGSEWTKNSTSSSAVFSTTPLDCFSSNFGNQSINAFRVTATSSLSNLGTNASGADWYYYWSTAIMWKQVWAYASGTNKNYMNDYSGDANANRYTFLGPGPINGGAVTRVCMRLFDYAYNIKWAYKATTQRWNNFSDSSGQGQQSWFDFWTGLNTAGYTLGVYALGQDGTLAIIPSGSSSTTAAHDCNNNNSKVGYDDTGQSAWYGSSGSADLGAQYGVTTNYPLFFWIR